MYTLEYYLHTNTHLPIYCPENLNIYATKLRIPITKK